MKPKDDNKIDQIYKATLKLVKANGLAGITMQSVAKEADMATGTLYIYFRKKESIITSLFDVCVKNSVSGFFKGYDANAPFKTGFHTIWTNILQHKLAHFEEGIFIEQCFHSPYIDEGTRITVKKMFDPMTELIVRGKGEKKIKDIDTFWLLSFMTGSINELVKRSIYHNKKTTPEILDVYFQMCWDGIKV